MPPPRKERLRSQVSLGEQVDEMPSEHGLGCHRRRELKLSSPAMVRRDLDEQFLDVVDADGVEERLP